MLFNQGHSICLGTGILKNNNHFGDPYLRQYFVGQNFSWSKKCVIQQVKKLFVAIILYKVLFTTLNQNYIQEYQYVQQRMA